MASPTAMDTAAPRRAVLLLSTLLVLTTASTAVLGILLCQQDRSTTRVRHKAWRSCRKIHMQHLLFERARERTRREGRTLVVVGNPTGG